MKRGQSANFAQPRAEISGLLRDSSMSPPVKHTNRLSVLLLCAARSLGVVDVACVLHVAAQTPELGSDLRKASAASATHPETQTRRKGYHPRCPRRDALDPVGSFNAPDSCDSVDLCGNRYSARDDNRQRMTSPSCRDGQLGAHVIVGYQAHQQQKPPP